MYPHVAVRGRVLFAAATLRKFNPSAEVLHQRLRGLDGVLFPVSFKPCEFAVLQRGPKGFMGFAVIDGETNLRVCIAGAVDLGLSVAVLVALQTLVPWSTTPSTLEDHSALSGESVI